MKFSEIVSAACSFVMPSLIDVLSAQIKRRNDTNEAYLHYCDQLDNAEVAYKDAFTDVLSRMSVRAAALSNGLGSFSLADVISRLEKIDADLGDAAPPKPAQEGEGKPPHGSLTVPTKVVVDALGEKAFCELLLELAPNIHLNSKDGVELNLLGFDVADDVPIERSIIDLVFKKHAEARAPEGVFEASCGVCGKGPVFFHGLETGKSYCKACFEAMQADAMDRQRRGAEPAKPST